MDATQTSVPAAAPSSAPAAPSAPVAAPAAASSSPATVPAVETTAAPASTPEAPPSNIEDTAGYLNRVLQKKNAEPVAPDAESKAQDVTETPAEEDPAATTADPSADPEAAPPTTEDAPFEEPDDFDTVAPGLISAKELHETIAATPELAEVLTAHPELRDKLMATSRAAAEASAFREVFVSPEEAKVAQQASAEYADITDLVTSIQKPEDASGFWKKFTELSYLRDYEGNPIVDPKSGLPVSDGTVGRLIESTGGLFLNHFKDLAAKNNDDQLTAAVEILERAAFGKGEAPSQDDLTEEQRTREAAITQREQALRDQQTAAETARRTEYEKSVADGIDTYADTEIGALLAKTDVPEAGKAKLADDIRRAAYEKLLQNPAFRREQDDLSKRLMGPKTREARIALGKKWLNLVVKDAAKKVIADAGQKILSRQSAQQAAQAKRVEASRSEAAGSLRTAKPTNLTPKEVFAESKTALSTRLGREPEMGEILAEIQRRKSAA